MRNSFIVSLGVCAAFLICAGCSSPSSEASQTKVDLTIDPSPPLVGDADVSLTLSDARGAKLEGADVQLEGNMNHAGMKPSFAELHEVEPGRYAGKLAFTMGGDWFILVTAKTPDGKTVNRKIDVPGVKSP
ncbi:MAG: FixH family protein [Planctomycetales bacterium]|nr:FixH family protein [Planctomycetales bacterium]